MKPAQDVVAPPAKAVVFSTVTVPAVRAALADVTGCLFFVPPAAVLEEL